MNNDKQPFKTLYSSRKGHILSATVLVFVALLVCFALPSRYFRGENGNAVPPVVSVAEEGGKTDKFDDPFGSFEDLPSEDIAANFGDSPSSYQSDEFFKIFLPVAAIAAVAVAAILLFRKHKRKKRTMHLSENQKITDDVRTFVAKNPDLYVGVEDVVFHGSARCIYAGEDGVLLQDQSGIYKNGTYIFAAENQDAARKILTICPQEHNNIQSGTIFCHGLKIADVLRDFFSFDRATICYQTVYKPASPFPLKGTLRFEKAADAHVPAILSTYDKESPAALKKLVEKGNIYCAFAAADKKGDAEKSFDIPARASAVFAAETKNSAENIAEKSQKKEIFVGYIGQHPEGSMGLLYIFPEYRRHGYAEELERFQINEIVSQGRTPYAHIIEDNEKSLALQKKLGAIFADDKIVWLSSSLFKKST